MHTYLHIRLHSCTLSLHGTQWIFARPISWYTFHVQKDNMAMVLNPGSASERLGRPLASTPRHPVLDLKQRDLFVCTMMVGYREDLRLTERANQSG